MKIAIGSDHGAVELKDAVKKVLAELGAEVNDVGTFDAAAVDYPDIAEKVCAEVTSGAAERGIVLCGTGIGISIAANKIHGIRCALCNDVFSAKMSREHNNANVLAMGGRVLGFGPAGEIVKAWIATDFSGDERHNRRIGKISALEKYQQPK
ncbi:MAG: ribose 5-phosphate isomerase B [Selenomonadaceae bacterium]|nr:ribose 5-phosphate isomerase B [Selenomonadaceae bacterium]